MSEIFKPLTPKSTPKKATKYVKDVKADDDMVITINKKTLMDEKSYGNES